jgi:hypothetical protein
VGCQYQHEPIDGEANGLLDGGELPGRNRSLEPLLLFGCQRDSR